tara:strand:- start:338 stop:514 length:177 start_codon:yes stop_codon:yes gene_type:complete
VKAIAIDIKIIALRNQLAENSFLSFCEGREHCLFPCWLSDTGILPELSAICQADLKSF